MTGKLYADTVTIKLPGIETEDRDTLMTLGSTLPNGQIVDDPGKYEVILSGEGSNGCDLLVYYTVDIISSVDGQHLTQVNIIQNPTSDKFTITNLDDIQEVRVYSITGELMLSRYKENIINISNLIEGIYLIQVITDDGFYWSRVSKL